MSGTHTLARAAVHVEDIRKSRFAANAAPVDTPAAALAFVSAIGDPTATHNCWAYRIGQEYRFNDDGEPGGTAGRPILQAIDGQHLDRIVVVVTRWFGGIKLGAGGLVRAYGGCAAECLRLAERQPIIERVELRLRCDFASLPVLQARLADLAVDTRASRFQADGVELDIGVPRGQVERLQELVRDLTRGRGQVEEIRATA